MSRQRKRRYTQRGRSVRISWCEAKSFEHSSCEFAGHSTLCEKCFACLSGWPPEEWKIYLPPLSDPLDVCSTSDVLNGLIHGWRYVERLDYVTIDSIRVAVDSFNQTLTRATVWSLLATLQSPSGRRISICWSGRGTGCEVLRNPVRIESACQLIAKIDDAEPTATTITPCTLAPGAASMVLHEAVGHFAEAAWDRAIDLSFRIGCRVANELVSVVDDPRAAFGSTRYDVDDDGVTVLQPTCVIEDGVLVGQLHSLDSAEACGTLPTGNARSASVWDCTIPRMSNLVCLAGTTPEEQLINEMGNGIYIHHLTDGFSLGKVIKARIQLAEIVRNGRRTGRFLTGGVLNETNMVLTRLADLGNDRQFAQNSLCGKAGQILFDVGRCAPAMRFSQLNLLA